MTAPIALFAYARPAALRSTLGALLANKEASVSDLVVFHDGIRAVEDSGRQVKLAAAHSEVSAILAGVTGFGSVRVISRPANLGLSASIIEGVTEVCNEFGRIIVVEDDLVVSPDFLAYMNQGLDRYAETEVVASIHGYMYPDAWDSALPETFFMRGADCWGWATWKRCWDLFVPEGATLQHSLYAQYLEDDFNPGPNGPYLQMLQNQIDGRVDSWAIRWHASMFLENKLTLYPRRSLVKNIGFDENATNTGSGTGFEIQSAAPMPKAWPKVVEESREAKNFLHTFYNRSFAEKPRSFLSRLYGKIIAIVRKLFVPQIPQKKALAWSGDFESWQEASSLCMGYDQDAIVDAVFRSTILVRDGKVPFERDSVLFKRIEYSWPVTAYLMRSAAENHGKLRVLDFGGALGSHYFQNREFLKSIEEVSWMVVEQAKMVAIGKKQFQNEMLSFHSTIKDAQDLAAPDLAIMSSVLSYLPDPIIVLNEIAQIGAKYIVLDRAFVGPTMRLSIQEVSDEIYPAKYPCWFIDEFSIRSILDSGYQLEYKFPALDGEISPGVHSTGYVWKKKQLK